MAITQADWRKVIAEVVGTFFFFYIGIGSVAWAANLGGVFYVAIAHGLALAIAVSALGHVSGGHFNPAVTISLAVARKISPPLAVMYIIGQLVGGVLASLALVVTLPSSTVRSGVPHLTNIDFGSALLLEGILTFFLVLAVFGTAVDPRATRIGGFGIGLTVFVDILVGGPLTGGVMNPARAIAPAIVGPDFQLDLLVYIIGPIIGGIVAALLYTYLFLPQGDTPQEAPTSEQPLVSDRR